MKKYGSSYGYIQLLAIYNDYLENTEEKTEQHTRVLPELMQLHHLGYKLLKILHLDFCIMQIIYHDSLGVVM